MSDNLNGPITVIDIAAKDVEQRIDALYAKLTELSRKVTDMDSLDLASGYMNLLRGIDQRLGVKFGPGHALRVIAIMEDILDVERPDAGK